MIADTSLKTGWHRGKADGDRAAIGKGKNKAVTSRAPGKIINHIYIKKKHTTLMNKKDIVAKVIQFLVTVLSAVLTTFGLQGTM